MKRFSRVLWSIAALGALVACAPSDPLDEKVNAESAIDFDIWQSRRLASLNPPQSAWFRQAMKELQIYSVTEWQGQGADAQRTHLLAEINGKTLREAIARGYEVANDRLDALLLDQRMLYHGHQDLLARPDTTAEEIARVKPFIEKIAAQIGALEAEKRANLEVLASLRGSVTPASRSP